MWNLIFTEYLLGTAIVIFLIALGAILPSLIFSHQAVEEESGATESAVNNKKERIIERARFYKDKYGRL